MNDGAQLLVTLPLWLSVLLLAFVMAEQRYRALLQSAAIGLAYVLGATALLPREFSEVAVSGAGWIVVGLLACSLMGRRPESTDSARVES